LIDFLFQIHNKNTNNKIIIIILFSFVSSQLQKLLPLYLSPLQKTTTTTTTTISLSPLLIVCETKKKVTNEEPIRKKK